MDKDELSRLRAMYKYETLECSAGKRFVCGIDEAGRGPLAGPVVTAAVILPKIDTDESIFEWKGLNDSKKLSGKKRDFFYNFILERNDVHVGIGIISEKIIDKINILKATQLGMCRAVANLSIKPDCLLIDGMFLPNVKIYQQKIINGDRLSLSIAAASVIAKVTRDNIMVKYHGKFPKYGFDRHKGYGTKEHFKRIKEYGPCEIHRRSFYPINLSAEIGYD